MRPIPFNRTWHSARENDYVKQALANVDTPTGFIQKSSDWLHDRTGALSVYLTHSCTAALEMAAILSDIGPGDEVIVPSFTFPSTANAFVLRGATPVFVDIRPDTLNLDESLIEAAITTRTKAIVPMHYAGVACEMGKILDIAQRHGLQVIEDAAQAVGSQYQGKALGAIGHMGAYSFHQTKNIQCVAGGALLVNHEKFLERVEVVAEKGTNIREFKRGEAANYTWKDTGSAFLMSELHAALLFSQLQDADDIIERRRHVWRMYLRCLAPLEHEGLLHLPSDASHEHNAHIFYILLQNGARRQAVQKHMSTNGITVSTHYEPLHTSSAGRKFGRCSGALPVTEDVTSRLLRLPVFPELEDVEIEQVCRHLTEALHVHGKKPRALNQTTLNTNP